MATYVQPFPKVDRLTPLQMDILQHVCDAPDGYATLEGLAFTLGMDRSRRHETLKNVLGELWGYGLIEGIWNGYGDYVYQPTYAGRKKIRG